MSDSGLPDDPDGDRTSDPSPADDGAESRNPLEEAADATLASRAMDGDTHAFEVLARRHGPLMRVYSAKLLNSDIESDDVVQEAFLTGWRQIDQLDSPAHVRNWMMRIVTRKAIDRIRVRRTHDDIDDWDPPAPAETSPERVVIARLQMDAVWDALDKLPSDQRRCWLLRETAGYSYQEIGDSLGLPLSTVRGLLSRARRFLLTEMEAWR
ncbi:RNA polymerase sigma factor [Frondihabitans cladoniiphilus]|uniref:RNA polymerase sigma factor n=1 Tax=Frondihabitans cladoniiphilus TaxID=715785 RepID=A0ABP8VM59_9MICO